MVAGVWHKKPLKILLYVYYKLHIETPKPLKHFQKVNKRSQVSELRFANLKKIFLNKIYFFNILDFF